jgi:5-methylcytosine-specific restriction endonuclease McrA
MEAPETCSPGPPGFRTSVVVLLVTAEGGSGGGERAGSPSSWLRTVGPCPYGQGMTKAQAANTSVKRGDISPSVRTAVWARAAGCCVRCHVNLIGAGSTYLHSVLMGELAHNVGATASAGSPRALAEEIEDREAEENLILLCHSCHRTVDNADHAAYFTTEVLRTMKQEHEGRVRAAASTGGMPQTAALRVGGLVRGAMSMASQRQTADALLADGYLGLVEGRWQGDFLAELSGTPARPSYWDAAQEEIDEQVSLVEQAVGSGRVDHLSVFAIAPVPLLVYLGSRLDDKTDTRLYQKHRDGDQGWRWDLAAAVRAFEVEMPKAASPQSEAVLAISLTAKVNKETLPKALRDLPYFEIWPTGGEFGPSVVAHPDTLRNFAEVWRTLLAAVEAKCAGSTRWHLIAACPVTAAVEAGRCFMREVQPPISVYQRDGDAYTCVLQVNA